jgi:hypothetical protein
MNGKCGSSADYTAQHSKAQLSVKSIAQHSSEQHSTYHRLFEQSVDEYRRRERRHIEFALHLRLSAQHIHLIIQPYNTVELQFELTRISEYTDTQHIRCIGSASGKLPDAKSDSLLTLSKF